MKNISVYVLNADNTDGPVALSKSTYREGAIFNFSTIAS